MPIPHTPSLASRLQGPGALVRSLNHLPSSPEVLPKVMEALKDDSATIDGVAALICLDQGVSGSVLQLSNSAYYSNGERSSRIEDAVSRVGLLTVGELVTAAVASNLMSGDLVTYGFSRDQLWRLSFTCAIAAEKIAVYAGLEGRPAYTIGFFHMAGLIAIDAWNVKNGGALRLSHGSFPAHCMEEENRAFGFNNADIAASLLRRWSFHPAIIEPIRWQYDPHGAGLHAPMAGVLHVAKWLKEAASDTEGRRPAVLPDPEILGDLRIDSTDLDLLCVETKGDVENAIQLLGSLAEA
jgi:HD-like signal output (HDOD) protein